MQKRFPKFYFRDREHFVGFLEAASDDLVASTIYTSQIGRVFTVLALVEDTLVHALWICANVKVDGNARTLPDVTAFTKRRSVLKDKTFGNLINVLKVNGLSHKSVLYIQFVKRVRDQFIHRFFEDNLWPGDLNSSALLTHSRTLAAYEIIFNRANTRIWKILGTELFHEFVDLGKDGYLITNNIEAIFDGSDSQVSG